MVRLLGDLSQCISWDSLLVSDTATASLNLRKGDVWEESQNKILKDQTLTGLGLGKGGGHLLCWVLTL